MLEGESTLQLPEGFHCTTSYSLPYSCCLEVVVNVSVRNIFLWIELLALCNPFSLRSGDPVHQALPLDLSSMEDPARSISSCWHSSLDHRGMQAPHLGKVRALHGIHMAWVG